LNEVTQENCALRAALAEMNSVAVGLVNELQQQPQIASEESENILGDYVSKKASLWAETDDML